MRIIVAAALTLSLALTALGQTSENNPRLQKALERFPAADTDNDGILTLAEANAFKTKRGQKAGAAKGRAAKANAAGVPKGGEKHIYKTVGDVELPLYVYTPDEHSADSKIPAIVFFFGGGWTSGSPTQFEEHCKYLAKRGMVAITVEYRVASRHEVKVEDCIEDAKSAMRWVRGNAAKLGVDTDRIASGGGSAGGHLGACVAVIDDFNAAGDDLSISSKPNAMALFNPAMGVTQEQLAERDGNPRKRSHGPMEKCMPLAYASAKQPPCIMFFGTDDRLLDGAQLYQTKSKEAGNDCKIVTYDGQGHGFFNHGKSNNKYYDLTVAEMDKFLVGLGWLKAE